MAKSKFNFAGSPSAREINGAMQTVEQPSSTPVPTFTRKTKDTGKSWTLAQCRLPNDLHVRMSDYCHRENVSINEFITVAVREMLAKIQ